VSEKIEGEIRVLEAAREERERKTKEVKDKGKPEVKDKGKPEVKSEEVDNPDSTAGDSATAAPAADERAESGRQGADQGAEDRDGVSHKRSASVLSNGSDKSTKRQKK
jgi:DNA methyltransferase 1-associated protein 1